MDSTTRARLREALRLRFPNLLIDDFGPAAVEAGECDSCGAEPRLVMTCGPGPDRYLGRRCVLRLGDGAFCEGHADEANAAMAWAAQLPPESDVAARLWWVATGEVRLAPELQGAVAELLPLNAEAASRW